MLYSRPPLERMMKIHAALQAGRFPKASDLAGELEVNPKTILRDIEFMRDRMNLPVEYNRATKGFAYTAEVSAFPTMQITEGELLAMLVAEKALQQYRGTNFEKPLAAAFKKLAASLPENISINFSDWEQTISFRTSAEPILDLAVFDQLARATAGHQRLRLAYRKPGRKATELRVVDPYQLANINGEWFLFAWCHLRKDIRTFAPARIVGVEASGDTFKRPEKFSLERRLRDSFGVIAGKGNFDVVLRFDELVSDYIREKRWHPSQKLAELPDGGVELRLKLSSLDEIRRWVLGWGGSCRVVGPDELASSVRRAAEQMLGLYPAG